MIADDIKELHAFARLIGLNRCWFERGKEPHYDLMMSTSARDEMRRKALQAGAVFKDTRELVAILAAKRELKTKKIKQCS